MLVSGKPLLEEIAEQGANINCQCTNPKRHFSTGASWGHWWFWHLEWPVGGRRKRGPSRPNHSALSFPSAWGGDGSWPLCGHHRRTPLWHNGSRLTRSMHAHRDLFLPAKPRSSMGLSVAIAALSCHPVLFRPDLHTPKLSLRLCLCLPGSLDYVHEDATQFRRSGLLWRVC